eukprot:223939-Amphidinium_carterae.1
MEISTFKWVKKVKDPNEVVTGDQVGMAENAADACFNCEKQQHAAPALEPQTVLWRNVFGGFLVLVIVVVLRPNADLSSQIHWQVVERHGVPLKVFRKYMQSEVDEQSACWGLPFTLLLVVSYATAAITHDESKDFKDSMLTQHMCLYHLHASGGRTQIRNRGFAASLLFEVIRAVEDALEIEVEERAKFAYGGPNMGFKDLEDRPDCGLNHCSISQFSKAVRTKL